MRRATIMMYKIPNNPISPKRTVNGKIVCHGIRSIADKSNTTPKCTIVCVEKAAFAFSMLLYGLSDINV